MFTIRGENVYPSEIDSALNKVKGYGGEHRIIISRSGVMDELMIKVEPTPEVETQGQTALAGFRETVAKSVHTMLGIRAGVEVVACGTYPRTDFKARRVVDDRDMFREMNQKISSERKA
jgi:phenylacetate-CoA ligase